MRLPVVIYFNGYLLVLNGFFMLVAAAIGFIGRDSSVPMLALSGLMVVTFGIFPMVLIPRRTDVTLRESILLVCFGWLTCTFTGALPFYLHGQPFTFLNSMFESISGYSTTGASILTSVEDLPKGLLFWRAAIQWLGGIGIIAFALAIIPRMGQVSRTFLKAEYTGLVLQPKTSRAKDIVRGLFAIYVGLTVTQSIALMLTGLPIFDAVTTALTTLPTGGFSVRNSSLATYNSPAAEIVTLVFMILGGMNFVYLHTLVIRPKSARLGLDVTITYLGMLTIFILSVTFMLWGKVYPTFWESLRFGSFQTVSLGTSTGFASADSAVWPVPAQIAILFATIIGACSGSTGGGFKSDRILLFFKLLNHRFKQILHPNIVPSLRVDRQFVSLDSVERTVFYILPYLGLIGLSTWLLNIIGVHAVEAFTGTVACIANAGPGFGAVGSMGNFSAIPETGKIILAFVMLAGRLEIFALALPFIPGFWKK